MPSRKDTTENFEHGPHAINGKNVMSQKEVWKENRTGNTTSIRYDSEHWLSSVITEQDPDNCVADETANQLRQEKLGDSGQ